MRKGAIIGVYFETGYTSLPAIGDKNNVNQENCIKDGSTQTTEITCSASDMVEDQYIHAEAQIGMAHWFTALIVREIPMSL